MTDKFTFTKTADAILFYSAGREEYLHMPLGDLPAFARCVNEALRESNKCEHEGACNAALTPKEQP